MASETVQDLFGAAPVSTQELEGPFVQLHVVDVDDGRICQAGDLAEAQALRTYDAVQLAAALQVVKVDLVLVAGVIDRCPRPLSRSA